MRPARKQFGGFNSCRAHKIFQMFTEARGLHFGEYKLRAPSGKRE
jgi:hypothetical protein